MNILDIYAKGYAGATMGGTSFMVNVAFPKERFPILEEIGNDGYMLNILVPNADYGDQPRFKLTTKLVDKKDGSVSFWGEEEAFTAEESQLIQAWIKENNIEEQAHQIKKEIKEVTKKMDAIYEQKMKWREAICTTAEEREATYIRQQKLNEEHEILNKRYDELHGK